MAESNFYQGLEELICSFRNTSSKGHFTPSFSLNHFSRVWLFASLLCLFPYYRLEGKEINSDAADLSSESKPLRFSRQIISNWNKSEVFDGNEWELYLTNDGGVGSYRVNSKAGGVWKRNSDKSIIYDSGLWIGATVNSETKVSAVQFGSDFTPAS